MNLLREVEKRFYMLNGAIFCLKHDIRRCQQCLDDAEAYDRALKSVNKSKSTVKTTKLYNILAISLLVIGFSLTMFIVFS